MIKSCPSLRFNGDHFIILQYGYTQPPLNTNVNHLIRIILNSLEAQFHRCKRIPATIVMEMPSRSRDMSQPSLSGLGDRDIEREEPTPPISPFVGSEGTSGTATKPKPNLYTQKSVPLFNRKYHDSSLDADDTESELVAIPESDLSESTLHNSAPGSFDECGTFDEIAQPLKSDQLKGKVTTANLATAQVALSTLSVAERQEEKSETKKTSRLFTKLNSLDRNVHKSTAADSTKIVTKCSVQEGVRMMVTPSIFMTPTTTEKAVVNQQMNVQRAIVVQHGDNNSRSASDSERKTEEKDIVNETSEVDYVKCLATVTTMADTYSSSSSTKQITVGPSEFSFGIKINTIVTFTYDFFIDSNWIEQTSVSPTPRTLGRQQRVVEPSLTPSTTPISQASNEDNKSAASKPVNKVIDKIVEIGSPESPLSKMSIMPNPLPTPTLQNASIQPHGSFDGLVSPKSVAQLEFPTPERLLPIGQHAKDGIVSLADKVREVLSISDISHLKQESSFEKSEVRTRLLLIY